MADLGEKAVKQLGKITECSICMNAFNDPRMLPCIHTFCCECLKRTAEAGQKKSGDRMPCPLCRKDFIIPEDGINGLQKNGWRPLKCTTMYCTEHPQKPLDYYCADCKKILCVSCCVESHTSHKCKDVAAVSEEFRLTIQSNSSRISIYADEMLSLKEKAELRKAYFLMEIADKEEAIQRRNQELKDMIDEHTKSLLDELSVIKSRHIKEMETEVQEIDRCCTILKSFEAYCAELVSEGSPSDICSSFDQLIDRTDELEKDHEAFTNRPHQSVEVAFQITDLGEVLQKSYNVVGQIKGTTSKFQKFAIVVGLYDASTIDLALEVIKMNLHLPNEISTQAQIPVSKWAEIVANVYCNTMYVTALGNMADEIWKYNVSSGWSKCASLVQSRLKYSAAFIDEVLYICGGVLVPSKRCVLDSVEAFNAVTDECNSVGKLVRCVESSDNCVPHRSSLYIFGGNDENEKGLTDVQVYNTKQNTCTVLTKPMPRPSFAMRAVPWETSAILVGENTCLIFNFETETWQEREQFKTGVRHFGLVLHDKRVFVIGGGEEIGRNESGSLIIWKCSDDVRYVPLQNILDDKPIEWKSHGKLPKPSLVHTFGEMWMSA